MQRYLLSELHAQLGKEWKRSRPSYNFCHDGILDEAEWMKAFPKILFLLKESNSYFKDIGGAGWSNDGKSKVFWDISSGEKGWRPSNGASRVFWRNINIWSYVISEFWHQRTPDIAKISSIKENEVNSIAYVNIKKDAQNRPVSDNNDIYQYAIKDKDFLCRQIDLINPDVIYCCGTINSLKVLFDTQMVSSGIYSLKNSLIIDYYHPSCRSSYETTFSKLRNILADQNCLNEILRIKLLDEKKH